MYHQHVQFITNHLSEAHAGTFEENYVHAWSPLHDYIWTIAKKKNSRLVLIYISTTPTLFKLLPPNQLKISMGLLC